MTRKSTPLGVSVEGYELVIRVGINMLPKVCKMPPVYSLDTEILAEDVVTALQAEEEDGTTPVHRMLDAAIEAAFENGSLAFDA